MSDAVISYAAFILADAGLEITSENLSTITKAAGASIDSIWADVFATALEGQDLKQILSGFHNAGPAAGGAGASAASGAAAGDDAGAEEEAAEEAAEESDDDMGFGLFD